MGFESNFLSRKKKIIDEFVTLITLLLCVVHHSSQRYNHRCPGLQIGNQCYSASNIPQEETYFRKLSNLYSPPFQRNVCYYSFIHLFSGPESILIPSYQLFYLIFTKKPKEINSVIYTITTSLGKLLYSVWERDRVKSFTSGSI